MESQITRGHTRKEWGHKRLEIQSIAQRFIRFAEDECRDSSPLYGYLARRIAGDHALLELSAYSKVGQPRPNMLFAAVHYLLMGCTDHTLQEFYPSMTEHPRAVGNSAFAAFRKFCLAHDAEIVNLLSERLVQTNEVGRCAYLYPAFCYIYRRVGSPLSVIELGSGAGLQLLWDRYQYSYGGHHWWGDSESSVRISSALRRGSLRALMIDSPPVAFKVGVDLHVVNVNIPDQYRWLKALVWGDHPERLAQLDRAVTLFKQHPTSLVEGDGVGVLPDLASKAPRDTIIVVFHTHVANQFSDVLKHDLTATIQKIGAQRNVAHLYNNMWDQLLHLDLIIDGVEDNYVVGQTDGHGRWFDWIQPQ